jgi:outer membrane protein assembly factor BamA
MFGAASFLVLSLLANADGGVEPVALTPVVAPAYTPELGFLVAAGGVVGWSADAKSPRSSFTLVGGVSTTGAFLAQGRLTSFFKEDLVRLAALIDVRDQPDHFFGVGLTNGLTRAQGPDTTAYRRTAWQVNPQLQVKAAPSFFLTSVMDFTGTLSRSVSAGVEGDPDFAGRGGRQILNSGLGLGLTWDSRDVPVNAWKGMLLSVQWIAYGSWLGGTTTWQAFTLDYRHYVTLFGREGTTLCWQLKHRSTWGDVPWSDLSQVGTPWDLRAYRWGRFRDASATTALVELRVMLPFPKDTLWSRLGLATWLGVGALGSGLLPDYTPMNLLPSVGVGLRVRVQDRVTLRLDFGIGRGSYAFYFQFLEAF